MTEDAFRPALERAMQLALAHLDADDAARTSPAVDAATLRRRLPLALPEGGTNAEQVVEQLAAAVNDGLVRSTSGRFFAWVMGGTLPAALAADWLTSAWDQNAAMYDTSPAASVVEERVGEWLKNLFGLPASCAFALTTGCQMAHVTCLAAARYALLKRRGWDVQHLGLHGAPRIRIVTSTAHHTSIDRAVRLLGIGDANIVDLACDDLGRLPGETLERSLTECSQQPVIVVLQAGDLNQGAFDDFTQLVRIAHAHAAWVHVDGAFGLWASASESLRHLTNGIDQCDSWTTDGHKYLNVPYDCGYAFVRDPADLRAAMAYHATYLNSYGDVRNEADWNLEWSRRARAFPTFAALMQLGRQGVAKMIERSFAQARRLVSGIGALDRAEAIWHPVLNQGLLRFHAPGGAATEEQDDAYTDRVIERIRADGEVFFGGVTWRGRRVMRVSVSCWQTSDGDIARAIAAFSRILSTTN